MTVPSPWPADTPRFDRFLCERTNDLLRGVDQNRERGLHDEIDEPFQENNGICLETVVVYLTS